MTHEITTTQPAELALLPANPSKDARYRIGKYINWLQLTGQAWTLPDLAAYRDYLLERHEPGTVQAHLSTIRAQYRRLTEDNNTRESLYKLAAHELGERAGGADRKAFVDESLTRMQNATSPRAAPVKTITRQDRPDSDHLRLTREQAETLMNAPGLGAPAGLRDTAILALMLCTGIREAELCSLDVPDLRQKFSGELALHVRKGKGAKERLIPYGDLSWCLVLVDAWLTRAGIVSGPVFCGMFRGDRLRAGRLSLRAVEYIVGAYPIEIEGELRHVKPHDLRRTYARRLYDAGVKVEAIQNNLGHKNSKTTMGYIGDLNVAQRKAPAVYSFDLRKVPK